MPLINLKINNIMASVFNNFTTPESALKQAEQFALENNWP
jgi:hypothetical protein